MLISCLVILEAVQSVSSVTLSKYAKTCKSGLKNNVCQKANFHKSYLNFGASLNYTHIYACASLKTLGIILNVHLHAKHIFTIM